MLPVFSPEAHLTSAIISMAVGNFINWLLYGVLTVQLYLYYLAFPNDRKWMKAAVYTVYILETVQVIGFGIGLLEITLITVSSGNHDSTFHNLAAWFAQATLIALVSSLVPLIAQCIYAHRIRIITQRKSMPGLIITLAILQCSAAIATTARQSTASTVLMIFVGINGINDLIIAFILVRSLWKNKPLSNDTRMKVIRLIQLILATGSLTVAANFLSLAGVTFGLSSLYPSNGDLVAMSVIGFIPKLYGNSILVMLNNRIAIRSSQNAAPNTSTNVVSVLAVADNQHRPSGSAMSGDEVPFSSSVTTSAI